MSLFPYYVETFDIGSRRHNLGEFRRYSPACAAARRALDSPRVVLAVVHDRNGGLCYAYDGTKEWFDSDQDRPYGEFRGLMAPESR